MANIWLTNLKIFYFSCLSLEQNIPSVCKTFSSRLVCNAAGTLPPLFSTATGRGRIMSYYVAKLIVVLGIFYY